MRCILYILLITIGISCPGYGAGFDPFEGPKPIAMLHEYHYFFHPIDSETPRLVIYENGDVVYVKQVEDRWALFHIKLEKEALDKLREQWKPLLKVKDLKHSYTLTDATHQPSATFYINDGDRTVVTSVTGWYNGRTEVPGFLDDDAPQQPLEVVPEELTRLYKHLCALNPPEGQEWVPKYVEVSFWDHPDAPGPVIQWPKEWPSLTSDRAIKHEKSTSIYLEGALLSNLRKLTQEQNPKGVFEIDGKKMTMNCRFVFPGETIWRKAFEKAENEYEAAVKAEFEKAEKK